MNLQEKLRADLFGAVKGGDKVRRSAIRLVLAEIKNAEIDQGSALDDNGVMGVLAKEARRHKESIEAFQKGNRQDLVDIEQAELDVIQSYMPKSMSPEELAAYVRKVVQEVGATGPREKGKVMPRLVADLKGRAEGKDIAKAVSDILGG